jgi:hypothetical protein
MKSAEFNPIDDFIAASAAVVPVEAVDEVAPIIDICITSLSKM